MAVTLFIGGDAGVGGDGEYGAGQDDLQSKGVEAGCMNAPKARRGQGGRAAKKRGSFGNDCVPDAPGGRIVRD